MDESLTLHSAGFLLRRWGQDDLDALLRHANDPLVPRGLSECFPHPYTCTDGEAFLTSSVVDLHHPVLAIAIDGQACGTVAVRPGKASDAFPPSWGTGSAVRTVAAAG